MNQTRLTGPDRPLSLSLSLLLPFCPYFPSFFPFSFIFSVRLLHLWPHIAEACWVFFSLSLSHSLSFSLSRHCQTKGVDPVRDLVRTAPPWPIPLFFCHWQRGTVGKKGNYLLLLLGMHSASKGVWLKQPLLSFLPCIVTLSRKSNSQKKKIRRRTKGLLLSSLIIRYSCRDE